MQNEKRQNDTILNGLQNEHAKLWVCREMETMVTGASWLMATSIATDPCRRLPKRSLKGQVADVKNITGDDQATLRIDRNSANIAYIITIYVYEIVTHAM